MKFVTNLIALAALLIATSSHAEPLRPTSIPSSLAADEKKLMPAVMNEFYGSFDKGKACWLSTKSGPRLLPSIYRRGIIGTDETDHEDATYCMKPIRLDERSSLGRRLLFIVAGGQILNDEGQPRSGHPSPGVLGLIVLAPDGENLGVVATNDFYEGYDTYGGYPRRDLISIHRLGPNETYGWVAKLGEGHSGYDREWVQVYGVIGRSVKVLTAVLTYFSRDQASGCGLEEQERCSALSVKYTFETQSSVNSFFPIKLRAWGIKKGRPFHGSYRLVFDKNLLTYLAPNDLPDDIKPFPFIALPEPGTLSLACKRTKTIESDKTGPASMGIVVNFTTQTVHFDLNSEKITSLDDATVAFGEESGWIGTIDRVTGDTRVSAQGDAYSLRCRRVE